jgi:hypothetical protein
MVRLLRAGVIFNPGLTINEPGTAPYPKLTLEINIKICETNPIFEAKMANWDVKND